MNEFNTDRTQSENSTIEMSIPDQKMEESINEKKIECQGLWIKIGDCDSTVI